MSKPTRLLLMDTLMWWPDFPRSGVCQDAGRWEREFQEPERVRSATNKRPSHEWFTTRSTLFHESCFARSVTQHGSDQRKTASGTIFGDPLRNPYIWVCYSSPYLAATLSLALKLFDRQTQAQNFLQKAPPILLYTSPKRLQNHARTRDPQRITKARHF